VSFEFIFQECDIVNPRGKRKQKWTPLPTELTTQIRKVFEQNFKEQLGKNTSVLVFGKIFTQELCLRIGLHKKGELKHMNFEVSVDHNGEHEKVISQIHVCVDALAGLVQDYFENDEDLDLPYTWEEMPFGNQKIYIQFSRENPDLEAQADALLGEAGEVGLVNEFDSPSDLDGEGELTDALAEEISNEPSMFSGSKKKKKDDLH
jgi:hypothetical protein